MAAVVGRSFPQGSVRLPMLWTIEIFNIRNPLSEKSLHCLIYANDLTMVVRDTVAGRVQTALNIMDKWERLSINTQYHDCPFYETQRGRWFTTTGPGWHHYCSGQRG